MIAEKMKSLVANSSIIRAMFEEGERLAAIYGKENVFDFSLGNPNAEPPSAISEAIVEALRQPNIHAYMNNSGHEDVRQKIAQHLNDKHNTSFTQKNIIMTVGAAGGLNVVLKSILNPADEVILFAPYFGEYANYVSNMDGKIVVVSANTETFQPNLEEFEQKITKRTKAVIVNSPNNPSGAVYSEQTLKTLSDILYRKQNEFSTDIYLISDEPYRQLVYGDVFVPFITKYYKNSFVVYSFSKSLSLPGERIGYIVISSNLDCFDEAVVALSVSNRILGYVNAPSMFQRVVAKCINVNVDMTVYEQNMNLLYNTFTRLGFECVKPQGAFYIFPRALGNDGKKFCEAAKEFNLLLVPGGAFGCQTHFRVAFCFSTEMVERSIAQFEKLAQKIKNTL